MIWTKLKYFGPHERWGDPKKIDPLLLLILDDLRSRWGRPFIIHCAYETSGHSPNSYHYLGRAVDFHIEDPRPIQEQAKILEEMLEECIVTVGFTDIKADSICGLGYYEDWVRPGFHLDTRGYRARWRMENGRYKGWKV